MTAERRLAALEASLSPTELVLRWLEEAHAHGDLESYTRSLLAERQLEGPLDRLVREAAQGVRTSLRGKRPEVVGAAIRSALHETVFRFELVLRINVIAHDLIERETLLYPVFAGQLALLASEDRPARRADPAHRRRLALCRELTAGRVTEFGAAGEAHSSAERRYLDGRPALFPDAVQAWAEQLRLATELAVMADHLAELDGTPPAEPADPDAVSVRAAQLVADLVEPAKVTALEKLGEGAQALSIAADWLRPKLELVGSPMPPATPSR